MTLETLRIFTPYTTFFLAILVGVIGWFLKWMVSGHGRQFAEVKSQIQNLNQEIKELEKTRQADQKYIYEHYVNKEAYTLALGNSEGLIRRIFDQLNDLSRSVHQIIGALNTRDPEADE